MNESRKPIPGIVEDGLTFPENIEYMTPLESLDGNQNRVKGPYIALQMTFRQGLQGGEQVQ